jgi:hypothetical protein
MLPVSMLHTLPAHEINHSLGEMLGWRDLVDEVARVHAGLPGPEREGAVIFTANYSEAGAIELWGPALGLPAPVSGHNSYWWWGPPTRASDVTIAVGFRAIDLDARLGTCVEVASTSNQWNIKTDETGHPIWLCRGRQVSWSELWPSTRHYE